MENWNGIKIELEEAIDSADAHRISVSKSAEGCNLGSPGRRFIYSSAKASTSCRRNVGRFLLISPVYHDGSIPEYIM